MSGKNTGKRSLRFVIYVLHILIKSIFINTRRPETNAHGTSVEIFNNAL